jgi:hypothetical protein
MGRLSVDPFGSTARLRDPLEHVKPLRVLRRSPHILWRPTIRLVSLERVFTFKAIQRHQEKCRRPATLPS